MEQTFPLDSIQHIQSAWVWRQNKAKYLQLLAEFDYVNISNNWNNASKSLLLIFINCDIRFHAKSVIKEWL